MPEAQHSPKKSNLTAFQYLAEKRSTLLFSTDYFSNSIHEIHPLSFHYMSLVQKQAMKEELSAALIFFSLQYQLDKAEKRRQNLEELAEKIEKTRALLCKLEFATESSSPEQQHAEQLNNFSMPMAYFGLEIGRALADEALRLIEGGSISSKDWAGAGKTTRTRYAMGEFNERRLYWVWGGGFTSAVVAAIPANFAHQSQAAQALNAFSVPAGYISWTLYFVRFAMELSLLLKHWIAGDWMSKEEENITPAMRFWTQWHQRKFKLLNDLIWGAVNYVCFAWLVGAGQLGYYGNILTTGLLILDAMLVAWRFYEEKEKHEKSVILYQDEIDNIKKQREKQHLTAEENERLVIKEKKLQDALAQYIFEWKYKYAQLVAELSYSTVLIGAFALLCCFLFPPASMAASTSMILGLAGAALCFVLTLSASILSTKLDIEKSKEMRQKLIDKRQEKIEAYNKIDDKEEASKKLVFLELAQITADIEYQGSMAGFQKKKLLRALVTDAFIPFFVFLTLTFLPMGAGLGVLATGLAIALVSKILLDKAEPKRLRVYENESDFENQHTLFANKRLGGDLKTTPVAEQEKYLDVFFKPLKTKKKELPPPNAPANK